VALEFQDAIRHPKTTSTAARQKRLTGTF